jgi:DNA ligase (NAD+)
MNNMKELISKLNKWSYSYYSQNGEDCPSDDTYDKLYDELLLLEKTTGVILSNSPTQKVGNVVLDKLTKITHEYPLLSLDKTKSIDELKKFTKNKDCILMHKLDGLTIDITYDNGKLIRAETRGNGIEGEDVTENVKQFTNVPLTISDKNKLHVVGEAIITYDIFDKINSKLPLDKQYKNPRNLVSGSVRQLDSLICKEREVKFIAYNLLGTELLLKDRLLNYMMALGFDIVKLWSYSAVSSDNLEVLIDDLKQKANQLQIPIDGLVMTFRDIEYGESLGSTSHHPLHSYAFKFNDDVEITKLIDVEFQVGRTGRITPVAIFEPVELDGSTVTNASLHNVSILKELCLHKGDSISVYKANQIIPQVKDNLDINTLYRCDTLQITHAYRCPVCGAYLEIVKSDNSESEYCINPNCKAKLIQQIAHYVSRDALNIEGLSEKTIEKLIDLELLKSVADIYYLPNPKAKEIIIKQDGFGIKSYNNLVQAIEKSKQCKLANLLLGLGIDGIGKGTSARLVEHFKGEDSLHTLNSIIQAKHSDILEVNDCGEVIANSITEWFSDSSNLEMLSYITQCVLTFEEESKVEVQNNDNILFGKKVYPTGKFTLNKKDLKIKLEELGAIVSNGYSKSLDYLICGGDTSKSGKVNRAIEDNVPLLLEETLLSLIK